MLDVKQKLHQVKKFDFNSIFFYETRIISVRIESFNKLTVLQLQNFRIFQVDYCQNFPNGKFSEFFRLAIFGIFQIANFSNFLNCKFFEFSELKNLQISRIFSSIVSFLEFYKSQIFRIFQIDNFWNFLRWIFLEFQNSKFYEFSQLNIFGISQI